MKTNLQRIREEHRYSQRQLSILADVNLRTIQAYEQRKKNINHAQAGTLLRISKKLKCSIEELLEQV